MARVTGVGGIFFKSTGDKTALAAWYEKHLGMRLEPWGGAIFRWPDDKADDRGLTVWHVAEKDTQWFCPSRSSFMVNYVNLLSSIKAEAPDVYKNTALAAFPGMKPGEPARVTLGGFNVGVGAFGAHPRLAFEAATCLGAPAQQRLYVKQDGLPPVSDEVQRPVVGQGVGDELPGSGVELDAVRA